MQVSLLLWNKFLVISISLVHIRKTVDTDTFYVQIYLNANHSKIDEEEYVESICSKRTNNFSAKKYLELKSLKTLEILRKVLGETLEKEIFLQIWWRQLIETKIAMKFRKIFCYLFSEKRKQQRKQCHFIGKKK